MGFVTSVVLIGAAFAVGVEFGRRHAEDPWGYLRDQFKDLSAKCKSTETPAAAPAAEPPSQPA